MLKKTANLFTTAYLLLMFCVYPFYIERGYENFVGKLSALGADISIVDFPDEPEIHEKVIAIG